MPVISMISPKGGVGKTTTALILALELARRGKTVEMIDADPNFPLVRWASSGACPTNITVTQEIDEENIISVIDTARKRASFVIVDVEGRASARATNVLLMSNLVLVPMQGSALDAHEAARAFKSVRSVSLARERQLPFAAVLTRAPASDRLWTRDLKAVASNLQQAGVLLVPTALAERGAYRALFSVGGTLESLSPSDAGSLDKAKSNASSFADDVIAILNGSIGAVSEGVSEHA